MLRGQRLVAEVPVLDIEAHYRGRHCHTQTLHWQNADGSSRRFHYALAPGQLHWDDGDAADSRSLALPSGALQFPLLRAATGRLLQELAGGAGPVVLPNLRVAEQAADFLHPIVSERWVEAQAGAGHYRYFGGEYGDAGAEYWLDEQAIVQRYRWLSPTGLWEIRLQA